MSKEKNKLKPINTPSYNYWSALYKSFYSRFLYVDVGKRWKGFGILYLLLAIAILSIPFTVRMSMSLNQSFKEQITDPLMKIPVFYIQNGNVLFGKPMPYLVNNDKNQTVAIVDTTGKVNDFTNQYPYLTILITKNQIAFKIPSPQLFNMGKDLPPAKSKPIIQPFDKETNLVFDGRKLVEENSVTGLKFASQIMLYPLIVALFFGVLMVFFLVLALLGQTFANIFFSFKISFATSSRLLVIGATPMLLLLMTMLTINTVFQGLGVLLFFLLIAYYSFALYALRAESRRLVTS